MEINNLDFDFLLQKETPKEPLEIRNCCGEKMGFCPTCDEIVFKSSPYKRCPNCGQVLEW